MQRTMLSGLVAAAVLAPAQAAVVGRHAVGEKPQAQLRATTALAPETPGEDALLRHRFAVGLGLFNVPGEIAAGEEKKEVGEDKKQAKDKEAGQAGQPVTMQVPEDEIKNLSAKLSPGCQTQFADILHGKSQLHTFGDAGAQSEGDCTKMHGGLCAMDAHLTQTADHQGRSIKSTTHVKGDSCLPKECMAGGDLEVLANFMKLKAQDTLGGADVDINLHVDCSSSGGSVTHVGGPRVARSGNNGNAAPRVASGGAAVLSLAVAAALM